MSVSLPQKRNQEVPKPSVLGIIACLYAVIGLALVLMVRYSTWSVSPIRSEPRWYQSDYLPIGIACFVFAVVSYLVHLPKTWLYGLLITGPPYGWILSLLLEAIGQPGQDKAAIENARTILPLVVGLALSGAVLHPLIASLVSAVKRTAKDRGTTGSAGATT